MRVGLLARAENRGLGNLTWEFFRHIHPVKTLVVEPDAPWTQRSHVERYEDARVVRASDLDAAVMTDFLRDIDVLYTAETPYLRETFALGRAAGVRTVLHLMPEFAQPVRVPAALRPDAVWVPTSWRQRQLRAPTRVVPVPVDRSRVPFRRRTRAELFVHHAGTLPRGDRNGTRTVLRSLRHVTEPVSILVRAQRPLELGRVRIPRHVELEVEIGDVPNYWELYERASVLLLPRRYGGLSLPMNEALSSGMAVIASDVSPQDGVLPPASLVRARRRGVVRTHGTQLVPTSAVAPRSLARTIDRFAADPALVGSLSEAADRLAEELSWRRWRDRYVELLAAV
ncbi:MAG: hypothetical protein V7636_1584 [Actinomycetota bacterium]|jgi:glycosyltransferase involved in cell wall biosynthesis